jgi:hypothetical protein
MTEPSTSPKRRSRSRTIEAVPVSSADASTPETESLAAAAPASVEVVRGAVARVDATTIDVHQGAVGAAQAGSVSIEQGALGAAMATDLEVRQSVARLLLARTASVEQSFVRMLVANEVRVERATGVGIIFARRVVGDVRVLLDWRGAIAFGAAAGFVLGLMRRGRSRAGGAGDGADDQAKGS